MYEIERAFKLVEEDSYENGCIPDTAKSWTLHTRFSSTTVRGLLNEICKLHGADVNDVELNSCGEDGRIDVAVMEDAYGNRATERDLDVWKEGRRKLYSCIYTYYIHKVEREVVRLVLEEEIK